MVILACGSIHGFRPVVEPAAIRNRAAAIQEPKNCRCSNVIGGPLDSPPSDLGARLVNDVLTAAALRSRIETTPYSYRRAPTRPAHGPRAGANDPKGGAGPAPPRGGSNHLVLAQLGDLILREAEFGEHLFGLLAEFRRPRRHPARRARQREGLADEADLAVLVVRHVLRHPEML